MELLDPIFDRNALKKEMEKAKLFIYPSQAKEGETFGLAVLEAMSKRGESYANDHGGHGWRNPIRSDTGPLLASLIAQHDAHRILEVGTAHGLSALYLVMGWEDIDGRSLETIEFDAAVAAEAQSRFKALGMPVTVHAGEAMEVITQRLSGRFDAVFLNWLAP